MNRFLTNIVTGVLMFACIAGSMAEEISKERIKTIDEQVQDIKKDVLNLADELIQLEEKLIYPSGTQVSLFVSIAKGEKFHLDAINIKIDDKDATHHIYTLKELEALHSGGIQRVHTGNIRTGEHTLDVSIIGKTGNSNENLTKGSFKFTKTAEPKLIEITLAGSGSRNKHIEFKD